MKDIPKHWQYKKLGEVCEVIMGQSPPSTTYNSNGVGLPFFQGKAEFTELYPDAKKSLFGSMGRGREELFPNITSGEPPQGFAGF